MNWSQLTRPGDWMVVLAGLAAVVASGLTLWGGPAGETVVVRGGGKIIAEATLSRDRTIAVPGPLGTSVIDIHQGRVRVRSDPSPRQYCVQKGWLSRAGEAAICLPNQVSVEIRGAVRAYDSLNY